MAKGLEEVQRIKRVADMLCTGHATLRDRYKLWALLLDLTILSLSAWLVALAFVDPIIAKVLTPARFSPAIWLGLLAVGTFLLSLFQLKIDWKGKAASHGRSLVLFAEAKREAAYVLSLDECSEEACKRVLSRYDVANSMCIEIPERAFLSVKKSHRLKLEMSKVLDVAPSTSLLLLRCRLFVRDNFTRRRSS